MDDSTVEFSTLQSRGGRVFSPAGIKIVDSTGYAVIVRERIRALERTHLSCSTTYKDGIFSRKQGVRVL